MKPELIADYKCEVGEGPLWDPQKKCLYWSDIPNGKMFRYYPDRNEHEQFYNGEIVGGFTIQENGSLLLFMSGGAIATWDKGNLNYLIDKLPGEENNRFNDVFADPNGRVFCGTMPQDSSKGPARLGTLYRLDRDLRIFPIIRKIGISNGMGLTPDRTQLYYTDTDDNQIHIFDYTVETGSISNKRVFVDIKPESDGYPDGMTVDAEGYVWSARWGGSSVIRYDTSGREERRITLPAKNVTSVIFGGDKYEDMYITTGGGEDKASNGIGAGGLFRIQPGVKGVAEFSSSIGI